MMRKVWPVLLAAVLVLGFAMLGCGGGFPTPPSEPIVIDDPQFVGWGGLGGEDGNTFDFDTGASNPCCITYTFPAEAAGYTDISMEYTLTVKGGETLPMKITIKSNAKDDWAYDPAKDLKYLESATTADMTYEEKVSSFINDCLTIAHNTYNDESSSFTITITKITFTKD